MTYNPLMITEPGYNGQLVSLGGVLGAPGKGRQMFNHVFAMASGAVPLLSPNPMRIAALIQNADTTLAVLLYVGTTSTLQYLVTLNAGGSLQIDQDFPWIEYIWGSAASGAPAVLVTEIAVQ